ncbi:hypothetical protein VF14_27485 [Nostoc linckia z18]|uniref:Uncharacterized protein n=2 Tax=Nostoc linckia TaxID=92942 RepID=A0A9Q5Z7S9_NOSLI|nr:hypothetical protein [Nostoc linckia]PHK38831.1 hypothetical protein VF12_16680 [Nostoc linckia z15]PHK43501.1 hypothetical protein VF13_26890 [Nostoc linckia z16]PHJ56244.1 hypothetical protein VF02_33725 [Nostoc linckia z1]PHJ58124.1 hypothetical protein VF05_34615 [Nostoc linckia z3]PHJ60664.1 hypothetical protein VF03_33175 [Nostoc linckia z2]
MINKGSLVFTFSSLLLFSLTGIAYAQKTTISCPDSNLNRGSVCINERGTVINNHRVTINIYQNTSSPNAEVSSPPPKNTQPNPFVIHRQSPPQELLVSDGELPPLTTFPGNSAFTIQRKR